MWEKKKNCELTFKTHLWFKHLFFNWKDSFEAFLSLIITIQHSRVQLHDLSEDFNNFNEHTCGSLYNNNLIIFNNKVKWTSFR